MKVGRIAKNIYDFKGRCFLAGNPVRVNRIYNGELVALAQLAHNSKRLVKVSIDRDNLGAVRESLDQFSGCNFSGGQHDSAPPALPQEKSSEA